MLQTYNFFSPVGKSGLQDTWIQNSNCIFFCFQNCNPISYGDAKYNYHKNREYLTVNNVEPSDAGIYVCELQFMHNDLQYKTSRTIDFDVKGTSQQDGNAYAFLRNLFQSFILHL